MRRLSARSSLLVSVGLSTVLGLSTTGACSSSSPPQGDAGAADGAGDTADVAVEVTSFDTGVDGGVCPAIAQAIFGGTTCTECAAMHCCPLATTCFSAMTDTGEADCALLGNCIADCGDDAGADGGDAGGNAGMACTASCNSRYPAGVGGYNRLNACVIMACRNDAGTGPCNL
jgi:hypothetical protein